MTEKHAKNNVERPVINCSHWKRHC